MSEKNYCYLFKLFHNIKDEHEVELAKKELLGLLNITEVKEVNNFVDLFLETEFKYFTNIRAQDFILRNAAYGKIQGFLLEMDRLLYLTPLVVRLAYISEIYVISPNKDDIHKMFPEGKENINVKVYPNNDFKKFLFRIITNTFFLEQTFNILKFSFARSLQASKIRISKNLQCLFRHIFEGTYRIPLPTDTLVGKELEDLFDERLTENSLYLTHAFGPPYKAKFHPRMVKALINYKYKEGIVLDPFVGSGTTNIETSLMGIPSIGVDINPLSEVVIKAKVCCLDPEFDLNLYERDLEFILSRLDVDKYVPKSISLAVKEILKNSNIALDILTLKNKINNVSKQNYFLFLTILAKVISKVSKKAEKLIDVYELFSQEAEEVYKVIFTLKELRKYIYIPFCGTSVFTDDSRKLETIKENISYVVTSPPYSTAIDYVKNDYAQLVILELCNPKELDKQMIGNPREKIERTYLQKVKDIPEEARKIVFDLYKCGKEKLALRQIKFLDDMKKSLEKLKEKMQKGGYIFIIIGNNSFKINNKWIDFDNASYIIEIAKKLGFKFHEKIDRPIHKTTRGNIIRESIIMLEN
jgi:hypothetical protein